MTNGEIRETTRCPRCGAGPGMRCIQGGKPMDKIHPARRGLAESTTGWQASPMNSRMTAARERWRQGNYERKRGRT